MAQVIISIISPTTFKIKADSWQDDEFNIDYLEVESGSVGDIAFSGINKMASVNTFIDGRDAGYYTLIVKNSDVYVLAKGEIDKLGKR